MDLNADDVRDAGEPGLEGITVFLDLNANGQWENTEPGLADWTVYLQRANVFGPLEPPVQTREKIVAEVLAALIRLARPNAFLANEMPQTYQASLQMKDHSR